MVQNYLAINKFNYLKESAYRRQENQVINLPKIPVQVRSDMFNSFI